MPAPATRKTILTLHIASAVALLGTSAGLAVMAGRAGASDDVAGANAVYEVMQLLTLSLGIPLSFTALLSGAALALTGPWGLFRYWWVTAKLVLLVAVIVVGATVTGTSIETLIDVTEARPAATSDARWTLVAAVAAQATMVLAATALAVVRPGGRIRRAAPSGA
jgi:hypothetical protein